MSPIQTLLAGPSRCLAWAWPRFDAARVRAAQGAWFLDADGIVRPECLPAPSGRRRTARELYQVLLFQLGQYLIQLGAQLQRPLYREYDLTRDKAMELALPVDDPGFERHPEHAGLEGYAFYVLGEDYGRVPADWRGGLSAHGRDPDPSLEAGQ